MCYLLIFKVDFFFKYKKIKKEIFMMINMRLCDPVKQRKRSLRTIDFNNRSGGTDQMRRTSHLVM